MRQTLTSMQWVIWSTKAALHSQLIIVYKTHTHIRIISSSTFEQCNWKPIQVYCFKHLLQHRQQHNTHRAVQLSHLHSKPYRISQKANFPYCHQSHSNTDNVNELFVIGNAGFMWMREQLNTICMRWISQPASPTAGNDKLVSQLCVCVIRNLRSGLPSTQIILIFWLLALMLQTHSTFHYFPAGRRTCLSDGYGRMCLVCTCWLITIIIKYQRMDLEFTRWESLTHL